MLCTPESLRMHSCDLMLNKICLESDSVSTALYTIARNDGCILSYDVTTI